MVQFHCSVTLMDVMVLSWKNQLVDVYELSRGAIMNLTRRIAQKGKGNRAWKAGSVMIKNESRMYHPCNSILSTLQWLCQGCWNDWKDQQDFDAMMMPLLLGLATFGVLKSLSLSSHCNYTMEAKVIYPVNSVVLHLGHSGWQLLEYLGMSISSDLS